MAWFKTGGGNKSEPSLYCTVAFSGNSGATKTFPTGITMADLADKVMYFYSTYVTSVVINGTTYSPIEPTGGKASSSGKIYRIKMPSTVTTITMPGITTSVATGVTAMFYDED